DQRGRAILLLDMAEGMVAHTIHGREADNWARQQFPESRFHHSSGRFPWPGQVSAPSYHARRHTGNEIGDWGTGMAPGNMSVSMHQSREDHACTDRSISPNAKHAATNEWWTRWASGQYARRAISS